MNEKATILVVDDDSHMLHLMQRILDLEGYQAFTVPSGAAALSSLGQKTFDLVLLDVMMPGMDGFAVCQRIRKFSDVPIIIVTAKGKDEDKALGLDYGADDYVAKPFSAKELMARVRAVLRRAGSWDKTSDPAFRYKDLVIDYSLNRVSLGHQEVELSATAYRLLCYLARNAGRIVAPTQILKSVWGEEYVGESHLLQVNIARLRQKLQDDPQDPTYVLTRHGIGYMMSRDA